jgi:capsular polysaccharide transport system permease protein
LCRWARSNFKCRRGRARRTSASRSFEALVVQARIVRALTIREVLHRYGGENLGFFWVIGEPMTLTFGVMVLWTYGG